MVSFTLTEEQEAIRDLAREFGEREIKPIAAEADRQGEFPMHLVEKAHAIGLINLTVPEQYGGGGLGLFEEALVAEELGAACAGITTSLLANSLALTPIVLAGSEAQLREFIEPLCKTPRLSSFCLTEPNAGSDVAGMQTTVHREGDAYVINGTKQWITNGGLACLYTVFATLDPKLRHKGICCLIVPAGAPGIHIGKHEDKMGQRASDTRQITFENVRVPVQNLLGKEGEGFRIAMRTLDRARASVAALSVGIARAAMAAAVRYSQERQQFGQPISQFQGIQFMLADMAIKVETARLMVWKAAWMVDQGMPNNMESSIAKCYASDIAMQVTTDAVQVYGGYGYSKEYPVEKFMRDAKLMQIYEGTNQIQRVVISRHLLSDG